jgi:hypothetical protein
MVWMGMGWFWSSLCGTVWSIEPPLGHTLGLIQHKWIVLAYNFNVTILVLIIGESCIGAFLLMLLFSFILVVTLHYHIMHLLSTNHKCTQPCYFPLLLKPTAQKERMDWNSSTRCSRLRVAPVVVPVVLWSLPLRVVIFFGDTIYVIIILYSWHFVICEHFWSYVLNNWSWVMHTMSTWFWHKNWVWQPQYKIVHNKYSCIPAPSSNIPQLGSPRLSTLKTC